MTRDRRILEIEAGTPVLLHASSGRLHVNPSEQQLRMVTAPAARRGAGKTEPSVAAGTVTRDGQRVKVLVNVNLYRDATEASRAGADGIGLYRSEFPFIIRNEFLSEEEQLSVYRRIVGVFAGREVVLRTADIGGDKLLQGREEEERNPFLGVRGIRFSLANRPAFRDQLRAMLRAGEGIDLGIMFPMVSSVEEIEEAREEVAHCIADLAAEGVPHNTHPRLGAMIELPSAALSTTDLAEVTDFLSVGTNDLVMYLLAVDRTNERLSRLYRGHHPTVLRTLAQIAVDSGPGLSELSVCGASASDPLLVPFLLGIGVRKLSVRSERIGMVRSLVSKLTIKRAQEISKEMLGIRHVRDMESYLRSLERELQL
jgi:phosphoenolpyruvate-protein kinase (PTS system EI component)